MKIFLFMVAVVYLSLATVAPVSGFLPCCAAGYGALFVLNDMWKEDQE
jgi:hypothetical protein